ncbi:hypothetical protein IQ260_14690 [Leptolyngbya cf. ectocarpi LEGE 11479]|uniref:Transmembrane protein n=1 Tax=Leptolyngbya cf. ectocarpi LEGE 11479 TaxID=1828722 RepID=A0A929FAD3_LEPEC|nr:hypothetical protein [Leptolyngbya ectocarpi]MBE9067898.1 hypothetical protein [Leptolyngbya cf. ectocarpi LEGE 11479]
MMQKSSEYFNSENDGQDSEEISNLALAYEYTQIFLGQCDKQIDDLNNRLTTFLGFGGLLLRFGLALPDGCRSCALFKAAVLLLTTISVCVSSYGLLANAVGATIKPQSLMSDDWFKKENNRVKASMTNTWIEGISQLEKSATKKQSQLNYSIFCIGAAVVAFGANSLISTFFGECVQ